MSQKSCIILAAGDGKRMKSEKPKVLMEVAFSPMLAWVLDSVILSEIENIAVIIGNNADSLKEYLKRYPKIKTFVQNERKGTGHAVMQAKEFLKHFGGDVLVLCGDAPFMDCDTIKAAYELHKSQAHDATVISAVIDNPEGYGRILRSDYSKRNGDCIGGIIEHKDCDDEQLQINEVNSGAYWFNAEKLLSALPKLTTENKNGEYYLTDTIGILPSTAYKSSNSKVTLGANDRRGLRELNDIAFDAIINRHLDNGVDIIGDCYISKDAVIGQDTVLLPGTVIREKCVIGRNCSVGPFVHLRPNTTLKDGVKVGDFVEIKNSVIGEKTSVAHLSYIGDSEVGSGVNFGCGCVTANYDGINKYKTIVGDDAFIGCNTNLIAPVKIGNNATTAAGSTITKDVPAGSLAIERGQQYIKEDWIKNTLRNKK
jgi:bifunctional UDP-N-acetylglucosamine pyrophosphorylase/glucosamine-1-phosphate N-acetyltransferase